MTKTHCKEATHTHKKYYLQRKIHKHDEPDKKNEISQHQATVAIEFCNKKIDVNSIFPQSGSSLYSYTVFRCRSFFN